jgi:hypothetical protein
MVRLEVSIRHCLLVVIASIELLPVRHSLAWVEAAGDGPRWTMRLDDHGVFEQDDPLMVKSLHEHLHFARGWPAISASFGIP